MQTKKINQRNTFSLYAQHINFVQNCHKMACSIVTEVWEKSSMNLRQDGIKSLQGESAGSTNVSRANNSHKGNFFLQGQRFLPGAKISHRVKHFSQGQRFPTGSKISHRDKDFSQGQRFFTGVKTDFSWGQRFPTEAKMKIYHSSKDFPQKQRQRFLPGAKTRISHRGKDFPQG